MRKRYFAAAMLAALAGPAAACSWSGISRENVGTVLAKRLERADSVVHARVVAVQAVKEEYEATNPATVSTAKQVATLLVLRSFKGGSGRLEVVGHAAMCGYQFSLGEENVYFISKGRVGIPQVEPASSWLLSALERAVKGK